MSHQDLTHQDLTHQRSSSSHPDRVYDHDPDDVSRAARLNARLHAPVYTSSMADRRASTAKDQGERAPDEPSARYRIHALDRALGLLTLVAERPGLGLATLASLSETSPSQTLKILATLEGRGLVAKAADKTYRLGYGAQRLGHQAARQDPVVALAGPTLESLRDASGESAHLLLRDGLEAVIADVRESTQAVRVVSPVGTRWKLHAGGSGKLFLAFGPPELLERLVREPLDAYTPLSETDPDLLRHDLGRVKRQKVAVSIGDFEPGAFSVAAPVFDADERMLASVAVAGPLSRFNSDAERRLRTLTKEAGARLADVLSGQPL